MTFWALPPVWMAQRQNEIAAANRQDIGIAVLEQTFVSSGHAPKRGFTSVEEFKTYFSKKGTILIDATEQRTQRPANSDYQKQMYSGKKKPIPSSR